MSDCNLFQRGIDLFNAGDYFEAHEAWEELWVAAEGDERRFLQALIHCAVGCYHHTRGNPVGAVRQWDKAAAKMEPFLPAWRGIHTEPLAAAAKARCPKFPPIRKV